MSHPANELFIENLYELILEHLDEQAYDEAEELMRIGTCHGIPFPSTFWQAINLAYEPKPQPNVS